MKKFLCAAGAAAIVVLSVLPASAKANCAHSNSWQCNVGAPLPVLAPGLLVVGGLVAYAVHKNRKP
ncbi:hypothetical protein CKO11_03470 [Rhodobacter sp. TJ_12]|uniref:hypothetical protein n=1 Tax=Rhodobacter sp. TJ_12 TaxID=2029399 RepID=UPI001CBEF142|nr:hypothetical protein [Rhodobacter sp. TJ_12]MBZ4021516.1 hypothetical protein [Rhodobacter sp. TJ_12]